MPITLGCPSCGKRFKARDESAGKRVKCPYCGVPVTVPTAEEAASAAAPTMSIPPPSHPGKASEVGGSGPVPVPPQRTAPPSHATPAAVATPDDWGAEPPVEAPKAPVIPPPKVEPYDPLPFPMLPKSRDVSKKAALPNLRDKASLKDHDSKTPEQLAAPGWKKVKGGLFWVLLALFFLAIPGFIGFAKVVLPRAGIELPKGAGWSIEGYINSEEGKGGIRMKKEDQIDILLYATPIIVAGLALSFGRLTCGAAPRSSGAKGMFAFSGLFTFLALAALVTAGVCSKKLLIFDETKMQAFVGFLILGSVSEFWFLTGLAASGVSLKRPRAARAVGMIGFFFALTAAITVALEMDIYEKYCRPKAPNDDFKLGEQAALMLGWILVLGVYWRAVGSVRGAIREFLESVPE
ncbi:MAG TPA: hypothetical protein VG097_17135 [Gemmata sp.]|nr:hypothetical protein [Gemmata sp.]